MPLPLARTAGPKKLTAEFSVRSQTVHSIDLNSGTIGMRITHDDYTLIIININYRIKGTGQRD